MTNYCHFLYPSLYSLPLRDIIEFRFNCQNKRVYLPFESPTATDMTCAEAAIWKQSMRYFRNRFLVRSMTYFSWHLADWLEIVHILAIYELVEKYLDKALIFKKMGCALWNKQNISMRSESDPSDVGKFMKYRNM
jgi:hypothetical protein